MRWNAANSSDDAERRPPSAVYIIAPAGAGGALLAQALASLRTGTALSEEPAPAVSLGEGGERVDAAGSNVGSGRIGGGALGLTAFDGAPKRALQIPHLAQTDPEARFVICWREPRETMAAAYREWSSGLMVTHPDLNGWTGPAWSHALIPRWRELEGQSLGAIVARQWASVTDFLLGDLEGLDRGLWLATSHDALAANPATELERLCRGLAVNPAGLGAAIDILAGLEPTDAPTLLPDELELELPEIDSRVARVEVLLAGARI